MNVNIDIINQLDDNYAYIVHNDCEAIIIDPADEIPILKIINKKNLNPLSILITHNHSDHTSGISGLLSHFDLEVFSSNLKINETTKLLKDNQKIEFSFINFNIIATPGHTLDHIVYFSEKEKILFSGDALFYYGCGRVFEGSYEQMHNSLKRLKKLPDETRVYCGHEYTYKNLEFVLNEVIYDKEASLIKEKYQQMIKEKGSSMPFFLGQQKNWNPFLNCDDIEYKKKVSNFHKNEGQISPDANDLEFFRYIRDKRNAF
tara:strand:+ start:489 stop:1268 length:780 start_codon:yes stop_codon:yes gene_type:complete